LKLDLKYLFIIVLFIGAYSCATIDKSGSIGIYGNWKFDKVLLEGKLINATDLNDCAYADVLELSGSSEVENFNWANIDFRGKKIGTSNRKVCVFNYDSMELEVGSSSCETIWVQLTSNWKRLLSIDEGGVVEYKIVEKTTTTMTLKKLRDVTEFNSIVPDKIYFKKQNR